MNHALKATAAARLYKKGVDEQLIQECLGNLSEAVCSYKCTSSQLNAEMSSILYGNEGKIVKCPKTKVKTVIK